MHEGMKQCSDCGKLLPISDFYVHPSRPGKPVKRCNPCRLKHVNAHYAANKHRYKANRVAYAERNKEHQLVLSRRYYASEHGRAKTLLKSALTRSKRSGVPVTIDLDFVKTKIANGVCEVTGVKFDLTKGSGRHKKPFAPSLDQIIPKAGYTPENTRMVVWQYNLMKGEMTDEELFNFCQVIVETMRDKFTP